MSKVIRIERTELRPGRTRVDEPYLDGDGNYLLAAPSFTSDQRKQTANVTIVPTIQKAANLIENEGYHIWMGLRPERRSLIQPSMVRIVRA
jgi:hypothetical protein